MDPNPLVFEEAFHTASAELIPDPLVMPAREWMVSKTGDGFLEPQTDSSFLQLYYPVSINID